MTEMTPTEIRAVYQFTKRTETATKMARRNNQKAFDPFQRKTGGGIGNAADGINRDGAGDTKEECDDGRASEDAMGQIDAHFG